METCRSTKRPDISWSNPTHLQMCFWTSKNRCSYGVSIPGIRGIHADSAPNIGQLNIFKPNFTWHIIRKYVSRLDIYKYILVRKFHVNVMLVTIGETGQYERNRQYARQLALLVPFEQHI